MSWTLWKLADLGTFKNGVNFTKDAAGEGRPFINVKDITGSHRFSHEQLDLVRLDVQEDYLAKPGDLFFVRSSVKLDGIGLVGQLRDGLPDDGVLHCGFVIRMRPNPTIVNTDFLMYLLLSSHYRQQLKNLSGGTAIINISQGALKTLDVSLPDLVEQERIAGLIRAYDDLIENNRRRIQLLEQAARLLYKEWFVHLRFPGHEHVKIIDGVPEGWQKSNLKEVAQINRASLGKNYRGEIEYIDISSVTPGSINETTMYEYADAPSRARRIVQHGDIIWSCVRPNRRSHVIIWNPTQNLIASTGFAVITPVNVPTTFLYQTVTTAEFVGYLTNNAHGVAYPAVTASDFENATIIVPKKHLLEQFNGIAEPMLAQINVLREQTKRSIEARDLLLPRLMNGEVSV